MLTDVPQTFKGLERGETCAFFVRVREGSLVRSAKQKIAHEPTQMGRFEVLASG